MANKKQETISRDNHGQTIWDKLQFWCEKIHDGKSSISSSQECLAGIYQIFVWEEDWSLGYNSRKFYDSPGISSLLDGKTVNLFGNSCGNSYIQCLLLIVTLCWTCDKKKMC